jgi:putative ABC transport system substrate-binding protein
VTNRLLHKRREFITLLGGAVAAWPFAAHAQQPALPVIGVLLFRSPETSAHLVTALRDGLRQSGYIEGQNVTIEHRHALGQRERLPALADDLIRRRVTVIVAGPRADLVAKSATTTIPIVFMTGGDPVRVGLVASLNRPDGNLTGVTMFAADLEAKRIGLLHELVPQASTIVVLVDANSPEAAFQQQQVHAAGRSIAIRIQIVSVGNEHDFETAFETIARERTAALMVASSSYFNDFRDRLCALAAYHRIPAIYEIREFAEAGGLMTYAPSVSEAYRQVGVYAGRILKGAKPADLPVMLPARFELVINLRTARALGLEVPPVLLARADEVIE